MGPELLKPCTLTSLRYTAQDLLVVTALFAFSQWLETEEAEAAMSHPVR